MKPRLMFRLGTTSYIFPADILPNVMRLATAVDDIELVLFEVDDRSSLPSRTTVAQLRALAARHGLTYTVHLPLDLQLAADDRLRQPSLEKACSVIRSTKVLDPWAYVVHLEGAETHPPNEPREHAEWLNRATRSLVVMAEEAGSADRLAVENMEHYSPRLFLPLLDRLSVSLCIDIGHLLNRRDDPLAYLEAHLPRTRVIHLHGSLNGRDHRGLDEMDDDLLASLVDVIVSRHYRGVVTLEVFSEQDFLSSWDRICRFFKERT